MSEPTMREKTNYMLIYQVAIKSIGYINETQELTGRGNYSRDLYPFRAIVNAVVAAGSVPDEDTFQAINKAMDEHKGYPGTKECRASSDTGEES